ncbi:ChaN family lipoprotein [Neolewinella antarctica]|uniref:Iron-regulated protein n=1 Tax=Neolewinella antarctica TaxID=442734 RepID=A0ABX0X766_9BACT|nr:ChaN family lipoprotein [Neolewinella antarctica]NJC24846.1 putative iron-regulated protein [Neolewinella antarctica]
MHRFFPLTLLLLTSQLLMAQKLPQAYNLFDAKGKEKKYRKLIKAVEDADVILFGEAHNDALGHWLQNVVIRDVAAVDNRPLALGLEMFETDQQAALEDFLADKIKAADLDKVGEGLWNNFATDYEPIIRWAHANDVAVHGTNVPRKYARIVFSEGFEGLEAERTMAGTEFPELPIAYDPDLKAYQEMLEMMGGGHGGANFPKAQAIKDATMAWRITEAIHPGGRLFHLNGSFHSDFRQGIVWYLRQYQPTLKVLTISVVEQESVDDLTEENYERADYIFAVPSIMTKTY